MWPTENDFTLALTRTKPFPFGLLSRNNMKVETNANGEPIKKSGNNSVVFKVLIDGKMYGLKCYTSEIYDHSNYLSIVQKYIEGINTTWVVPFKIFTDEELVTINGESSLHGTYTFILMPWIDGETLYDYVKKCCGQNNRPALQNIFGKFQQMASWILDQPFAHGDLSPENILVTPEGNLKLIDQNKFLFNELQITKGHSPLNKDYQHPKRNFNVVDLSADDFSVLILAISLRALQFNPGLFSTYNSNPGILFSSNNLREGEQSVVFKELKKINDPYLQNLLRLLSLSLRRQIINVPLLATCLMENDVEIPKSRELEIHMEELKNDLENSNAQIHFLKSEAFAERVAKEKQIAENKRLTEEINKLKRRKKITKKLSMSFAGIGVLFLSFGAVYLSTSHENISITHNIPDGKTKVSPIQIKKTELRDSIKKSNHNDSLIASIQEQNISAQKTEISLPQNNNPTSETTNTKKSNSITTPIKDNTPITALEVNAIPEKNPTPSHFTRHKKIKTEEKGNTDVFFRSGNF